MFEKPEKMELVVAGAKGAIGVIPVAGPILAELLGTVIVDKRRQRLESMLDALVDKVAKLEAAQLRVAFEEPESLDLLEEGLHQAARALSEDRKRQIAAVVGNAILDGSRSRIEQKRLLSILGELNDIELKVLFWKSIREEERAIAYRAKHPEVARPTTGDGLQDLQERHAIYDSYVAHLIQLRLIEPQYESQPEISLAALSRKGIGPPEVTGHKISTLGLLLLAQADLLAVTNG